MLCIKASIRGRRQILGAVVWGIWQKMSPTRCCGLCVFAAQCVVGPCTLPLMLSQEGGLVGGPSFSQTVPGSVIESIMNDNVNYLAGEEKFNQVSLRCLCPTLVCWCIWDTASFECTPEQGGRGGVQLLGACMLWGHVCPQSSHPRVQLSTKSAPVGVHLIVPCMYCYALFFFLPCSTDLR